MGETSKCSSAAGRSAHYGHTRVHLSTAMNRPCISVQVVNGDIQKTSRLALSKERDVIYEARICLGLIFCCSANWGVWKCAMVFYRKIQIASSPALYSRPSIRIRNFLMIRVYTHQSGSIQDCQSFYARTGILGTISE
jgi:hypothetical protein